MSHKFETDPEVLISRLSFSHIVEIMKLNDPLERFFYEFECISLKNVEIKYRIQEKLPGRASRLLFCRSLWYDREEGGGCRPEHFARTAESAGVHGT